MKRARKRRAKRERLEESPALGPGLVTGAADDDPSGIGTYSQVGAQLGYDFLWTLVLSYPLMSSVQELSARIGRATGKGLAGNMRGRGLGGFALVIVTAVAIANTLNIGANLAAMGAAAELVFGGSGTLFTPIFVLVILALEFFVHYQRYAKFLKVLTLVLLVYVVTAFFAKADWMAALRGAAIPALTLNADAWLALVAVLGTTISPYLLVWQASQEAEEIRAGAPYRPWRLVAERLRFDTWFGMAFSNLIALFIMLTCAATLHAAGNFRIDTAAEAAEALRPLAGSFASSLFALGIVGTGLLAVPVLAGSAAYAVAGIAAWRASLDRAPQSAPGFYGVIAAATGIGLGLAVTPVGAIQALFWAAVVNGVASVPVLAAVTVIASDRAIMGKAAATPRLRVAGWLTTGAMLVSAVCAFALWLTSARGRTRSRETPDREAPTACSGISGLDRRVSPRKSRHGFRRKGGR